MTGYGKELTPAIFQQGADCHSARKVTVNFVKYIRFYAHLIHFAVSNSEHP